ncbi:Putative auto-transporter adhesin, head GIN domain [Mucilaginibacter pineti]|uniref:Putative auto-transporter adhesin, head GIN domain n=1 Tax=Mucilaginibacter pineti TaxID=1391627 RepID=A0A1G7I4M0_9SPHI|nr:head GIN domain-containing protein [Mucilaginibacter pineti]SDF07426.1 Putative auto-transporter adhesin, head GIN domain [Mucilaginibacter pineti]
MKKLGLGIAAIVICASVNIFSACRVRCAHASGNKITETRKATEFNKIDISGEAYKIHLKQDSSLTITINGDDNLLKYISTSVSGGRLYIKAKKNMCNADSIVINIGIKNLSEIKSSGAAVVSSTGKINTGDINFDLSGATNLNLDINAARVTTNISGASEQNLTGQAASNTIATSGVAKINAFDFVVGDYTISTSGVSHCKINVLKTLNVRSSGATEIEYKGSPSTINNDKTGASKITKVD